MCVLVVEKKGPELIPDCSYLYASFPITVYPQGYDPEQLKE